MAEDTPQEQQIHFTLPPEIEDGVYANFALVHHTQHEVTIDFCLLGANPPTPDQPPTAKVVARIHIAPTFVMPLLQAISTNVANREDTMRQFGERGEHES
jgi:hypothetical protein